jgi:ABC-type multidrug transport system fused ATPase/permease subunit
MYCERCGKLLDEALNFCNACGAQLKKGGEAEQKSILNTLITAVIVVATAGIGVLVAFLAILLDKVPNIEPVIAFAIIYLATLFGICFMIMRQVSKLIDAKLAGKNIYEAVNPPSPQQPLVQLPPKTTAQLEKHREPASVTDSTTRTLDEATVARKF